MKKLLSLLLAVMLLLSCTLVVSADEQSFTMTAVKEIPVQYTMLIPQSFNIDSSKTGEDQDGSTVIWNDMSAVTITNATGLSEEKYLNVTLNHPGVLTSTTNAENTIPYRLHVHSDQDGDAWDIDWISMLNGQTFKWYPDETLVDTNFYSELVYEWNNNGTIVPRRIGVWSLLIEQEDWDNAPTGTYEAQVTFTVNVVDTAA